MLANKSIHAGFASFLSLCILVNTTSTANAFFDDDLPDPYAQRSDASGRSVTTYAQLIEQQIENALPQAADSSVGDERAWSTAQSAHASDPDSDIDWEHCGFDIIDPSQPLKLQVAVCAYPPPESPESPLPEKLPTTRDILYSAAAVIHADGAGLYKRPLGVSYTNKFIPTIVAVTSPTQTHVINLLGRDITITLTATNYEWNWGDGTPNLVTTSTGSVWSEGMDLNTDPNLIRHYYTPPQGWRSMLDGPYPHEDRDITLTTTWSGTATNPFTGETQTINGLVTTTETTGKFPCPTWSSTTPTPGKKNKATNRMIEGGKKRERLTVSPTQCASLVHRGHPPSPQSSQHPCLGSEHSTPRRMPRPRIVSNQHNLTPHSPPIASLGTYSQEIRHPRHKYRLRLPSPLPQVRRAR